jgi:hypothetical protein
MRRPSVEMYLCAFHVGKWEIDESVQEAYHRALDVSAAQFHRMWRDDCGALQEKHADAIHRMYEARSELWQLGNWAGSSASGHAKPRLFCAEKIRGIVKLPGQKASRYKANADRSGAFRYLATRIVDVILCPSSARQKRGVARYRDDRAPRHGPSLPLRRGL